MGNYLASYFGRMYLSDEDSDWDIAQHNKTIRRMEENPELCSDSNVRHSAVNTDASTDKGHFTKQQNSKPSLSGLEQAMESETGTNPMLSSSVDGSLPRQCKRCLPDNACSLQEAKCKKISSSQCDSQLSTKKTADLFVEHHSGKACVVVNQTDKKSFIDKFAPYSHHNKDLLRNENQDVHCCSEAKNCGENLMCAESIVSEKSGVVDENVGCDANTVFDENMICDECTVSNESTATDNKRTCEAAGDRYSPIEMLPSVLLVNIFRYLPLADLLHRASLVCKYWLDLSHDPDLWREVNVRGQLKVSDDILLRLVSYSKGVVSVDISDARSVTDEGVEALTKQCPGVACLKMMRCVHLKEAAFMSIGNNCPNIVHLYLDCCFSLSDLALATISKGCPKIRVLHINQCGILSNEGIQGIGRGCPELEDLSMDQCKQIGDPGLLALIEGCTQLKCLSAMSCVFTSEGIRKLIKLRHLQRLELHDVLGVTDDCMIEVVKHCKNLHTLNLSLCTRITDRSVEYIACHANNLRALYLASCDLTNKALVSLGRYSQTLEMIDVGWCTNITDEGVIQISETCRTLRSLGLTRCDKVTIQTMDHLVEQYPHIHYSTFWLDCRRLMMRAQQTGLNTRNIFLDKNVERVF